LVLAMSSLSRKSLYIGLTWIGLWLLGDSIFGVLYSVNHVIVANEVRAQHNENGFAEQSHRQRTRDHRPDRVPYDDRVELEAAFAKAAKTDWSPLFSYSSNLRRLGDAALGTDEAWVNVAKVRRTIEVPTTAILGVSPGPIKLPDPGPFNEREYADFWLNQYPWTWSAAALTGLLIISASILSNRVKSLDRLR
jgi:hypothetical protein